MPVALIIPLVSMAIGLLEKYLPMIRDAAKKGEITKEEQQEVFDKFNAIQSNAAGMFDGPEWDVVK